MGPLAIRVGNRPERRAGTGDNGRLRVSLPMSREDIADFIGLNPETVSRLFGRVKKAGLVIFLSPTEYLVPDIAALERRTPVLAAAAVAGPPPRLIRTQPETLGGTG